MNVLLSFTCATLLLGAATFAQDALTERYKQIRQTVEVPLPGLPNPPALPSNAWELWDLRTPDVSARTVALMNTVQWDAALYPLSIEIILEELMREKPVETWGWIIDNFRAFSPIARARLCKLTMSYPSAEGIDLAHALLQDKRPQGLPRNPALGDPQFPERVCDIASSCIRWLAFDKQVPLPPLTVIGPETDGLTRDGDIELINQWWTKNEGALRAKLQSALASTPAVQQSFAALLEHIRGSKELPVDRALEVVRIAAESGSDARIIEALDHGYPVVKTAALRIVTQKRMRAAMPKLIEMYAWLISPEGGPMFTGGGPYGDEERDPTALELSTDVVAAIDSITGSAIATPRDKTHAERTRYLNEIKAWWRSASNRESVSAPSPVSVTSE